MSCAASPIKDSFVSCTAERRRLAAEMRGGICKKRVKV